MIHVFTHELVVATRMCKNTAMWTAHISTRGESSISSEAFKVIEAAITKHYETTTLPTMSTGASDMAFLREKGMQCYGVGPATDIEDGPKGFGAHSDQERILEAELHRFVRFHWDIVVNLAGRRQTP